VFLPSRHFLSDEDEKKLYKLHNNDVNNAGYQKFVSPMVDYVHKHVGKDQEGLDFGSGTGPVISYLLEREGYALKQYDPFFCPDHKNLRQSYGFIMASEVVEHFHRPAKEFALLKRLLHPKAPLIVSTSLYDSNTIFGHRHYMRDPSHVFFYHKNTFEWIGRRMGFESIEFVSHRMIVLHNS
jgi:hypothetical protein